jgi:hypothetical protein
MAYTTSSPVSTVPCDLVTQIKAIVLENVPDDVMFHLATGGVPKLRGHTNAEIDELFKSVSMI